MSTFVDAAHNFAFIHIPRTGGTSIYRAHWRGLPYETNFELMKVKTADKLTNKLATAQHLRAKDLRRIYPESFNFLFKFTVVRNPWDRMVSIYYWITQVEPQKITQPEISFKDFLKDYASPMIADPGGAESFHSLLFLPQTEWVFDENGKCLVDFIINFEKLQKDYRRVCEKLDWPGLRLPTFRESIRRSVYPAYYDNETRELVGKWYENDAKMFGYRF